MVDVLMPEKRGGLNKIFSMFSQGSNLMQMGAKGKEGFASMFGGGEAAGGSSMGGGGAGALGLGIKPMVTQSDKVAPLGQSSGAAAGGESAASFAGPAVAIGAAAYDEGKYQQDVRSGKRDSQGPGRYAIGTGRSETNLETVSRKLGEYGKKAGLSLTESPDRMSAIERRYDSSGDAMSAIHEAQASLKDANLPAGERRSIYQKLELAKQQGGSKRGGAKSYT